MFQRYVCRGSYCIAGFSKGAIDALEYVLSTDRRVDSLQLFSPAFFVEQSEAFKRAQLYYFQKDPKAYIRHFLRNVAYPSGQELQSFFYKEGKEALAKLLYYPWPKEKLTMLKERGINLEVYLGGRDKIIDSTLAAEYFKPFAICYFIKEGGHILDGYNQNRCGDGI